MNKLLLLAGCGLIMCQMNALAQSQDRCGAQKIKQILIQRDPSVAATMAQHDQDMLARAAVYTTNSQHAQQKTTGTVTIPVVFHIVLSQAKITQLGGTSGIEARVLTQMDVLNQDYNRGNADSTLIPAAFKPLYGDVGIKFGLAHTDPTGNSTPGYEIITASTESFDVNSGIFASDAKHSANGGADSWNSNLYCNIWVVNLTDNGNPSDILGFSFAPSFINFSVPANEIGILLNYGAFGKRTSPFQYFIPQIDKGRTLTHEMGHFFELKHIWGDDNGMCPGNGGQDDDIPDTPPQGNYNYGAPSYPLFDACVPAGDGVMVMNYMDYTNDAKMQMFTVDQISRMQSSIIPGTEAYPLTQHPELLQYPTGVSALEKEAGLVVSPNPATGPVHIGFSNAKGLQNIRVTNMTGQTVATVAADAGITNYNIDMSGFSKGLYLIQCNFAAGTVTRKIIVQ